MDWSAFQVYLEQRFCNEQQLKEVSQLLQVGNYLQKPEERTRSYYHRFNNDVSMVNNGLPKEAKTPALQLQIWLRGLRNAARRTACSWVDHINGTEMPDLDQAVAKAMACIEYEPEMYGEPQVRETHSGVFESNQYKNRKAHDPL